MILLTEFFNSERPNRTNEIIFCIKENIKNKYIEKIYLFVDKHEKVPDEILDDKVIIIRRNRPTYYEMIKMSNELESKDELFIIANSDILFDESLQYVYNIDMSKVFMGLTRHDYVTKEFFGRISSQDAWIYKRGLKEDEKADFKLGTYYCDSRIFRIYYDLGYNVLNPSKKVKIWHYHTDEYRNYIEEVKGPYCYVVPAEDVDWDPYIILK